MLPPNEMLVVEIDVVKINQNPTQDPRDQQPALAAEQRQLLASTLFAELTYLTLVKIIFIFIFHRNLVTGAWPNINVSAD